MNVSLSDEWKVFVDTNVQSGRYGNASEVVRAGLRLLQDKEQNTRIERLALEALDSGSVRKLDAADFEDVKRRVTREIARRATVPDAG